MSIKVEVEKFIKEDLITSGKVDSIDPEMSLLEKGILDSLSLLRLIAFLEEHFGIKVEDEEVMPEYFDSLNDISAYVEKKRSR